VKKIIPHIIINIFYYVYKIYIGKKYNVIFYKNVKINLNAIFHGANSFGTNTEYLNSCIGYGSYIANNSIIRNAKIGKFCSIGDNVRTMLGIHPTKNFVSTSPSFFSLKSPNGLILTQKQRFKEHKYVDKDKKYVVEIGNDVWIGNNVLIMDGVKIGDGSVIAAGAIVTKDVEPYAIVGGIPAKIIKYRFDEVKISKLLKIKWWNKDFNWLKEYYEYFSDIDSFLMHLDN